MTLQFRLPMHTKRFRQLTPTFAALSAAFGLNLLNAVSPVELLNPTQWGQVAPQQAIAQDAEEDINVRVYREASPAVVSIETRTGTGSGSIISPDGLVLTNAHVVRGSQTVTVTLSDNRKFEADVVGFGESGLDLAAVRIRGQSNLPTVRLAGPGTVEVGQRAFAIGNPFGRFQNTFTTGIVSRVDQERGLLQTDAAINPGNSGGPLLNSRGEVIGVNSAIFSPRGSGSGSSGNIGIGFAISIDRVQSFLVAVRDGRAPRTSEQAPMLGGGRPAQRIAINNAPVRGTLATNASDLLSDNSYYNSYTFEGRAGQQVILEMSSTEVDPYLILMNADGENLAQDDDSGGGTTARLTFTLPANGTYTVLANTYGPRETGNYMLRLAAGVAANPTPPRQRVGTAPSPTPPRQRVGTAPSPTPQRGGSVILQQQDTLDNTALVLEQDGSLYREYRFSGNSGQRVTVSMESSEFDTYVIVLDSENQVVGENDDASEGDTNSALTVTLPRTGTYRVLANAYDRTGRGRFTLTIR